MKSHQLPSGPSPTVLWLLGMAAVSFSSHLKPASINGVRFGNRMHVYSRDCSYFIELAIGNRWPITSV